MITHYSPTSRSTRAMFAAAAIATVIGLFDIVAGLGDAGAEALAQTQAAQHATRIAAISATNPLQ